MIVKVPGVRSIRITSEYIKLDALLKFASIAMTGGEAKLLIQDGKIMVNRAPCLLRGKKIRPGDIVCCCQETLVIKAKNKI